MIIPLLTWETAQAAPHPERAWMLRPEHETEGLYKTDTIGRIQFQGAMPILNLHNYCIRVEYEILQSRLGIGLGHAVSKEEKQRWTQEMIRIYDPNTWAYIKMAQGVGNRQ